MGDFTAVLRELYPQERVDLRAAAENSRIVQFYRHGPRKAKKRLFGTRSKPTPRGKAARAANLYARGAFAACPVPFWFLTRGVPRG